MRFKVLQKGVKLAIPINQVVYTELFLLGRALEQFKPYFTNIQEYKGQTTNPKVKYMFLSQGGFASQLIQMFKDLEVTTIAE